MGYAYINNVYKLGSEQKDTKTELKKLNNRLELKKLQLEDIQYEYDLELNALYEAYKSGIIYDFLGLNWWAEKAQKWIGCLETNITPNGEKLDKRRTYEEKDAYNYLVDSLQKMFGRNDIELTKIYNFNFGEAWEYIFKCEDIDFILKVPIIHKVTFKSFERYKDWVFRVTLGYYKSSHVTETFFSTFEDEGFDKALEDKLKILKEKA